MAFLYHGACILFGAFGGPGPQQFADAHGWPVIVGYLVGLAQVGGGLAVLSGVLIRLGAGCISVVMLGAIFLVHLPYGFDVSNGGIEYALTQLLLAVAFLLIGPGAYSLASVLQGSLRNDDSAEMVSRGGETLLPETEIVKNDAGLTSRRERKFSEIVRGRRATPAFSSSLVQDEDLKKILRAGLEAPSSYNMQPWRFVVVRDVETRKRLRVAALNQEQVEQAPVVIVACGDTEGWREDLEEVIRIGRAHGFASEARIERKRVNVWRDLGAHPNIAMWVTKQTMIAATTMMWMAEALGYDTGPMEGFHEKQVREVLEIPESARVFFLLAIGRLDGEDSKYPGRLPPSRTMFAERYGNPLEL